MKKTFRILTLTILALAAIFLNSCQKENLQDAVDNLVTGQDLSTIQSIMENDEEEILGDEIGFRGGTCVIKTFSAATGVYPQIITLDFGSGCEGKYGNIRKGKLTINISADPRTKNALLVITPTDFYVDDIKVEGTRTWTNLGTDANGNKSMSRTVVGGKLTFPSGKTATFEGTETIVQTAGAATKLNKLDDAFEISGSRTGINRNGREYSAVVSVPLLKNGTCPYIVRGVINISREGTSRSLDYGTGSCDSEGILTLANGNTRIVPLKRWW